MSEATITIRAEETQGTISPYLHGHFAEHLGRCCYDGVWVGTDSPIPNKGGFRTDILDALREVGVPILRWPGGCFADTYHWKDGIGAPEKRPRTLAESCGLRVLEDNALGTHEFLALCREIGAEPYLAGNVGSGSPQELAEWIEYCNTSLPTTLAQQRAANGHPDPMTVKYWGVGNENWGCGGNYAPEDYAKEYRRFATFARMADPTTQLIACGHNNRDWNLKVVETLRNNLGLLDHLSVHQYYKAGSGTDFDEEEHYRLMRAGDLIDEGIAFTDEILRFFTAGRKKVKIAFDEWGAWHPEAVGGCGYEMPCTQRDAVSGAGVLDVFHRWADSLSMTNIAQIVNVLQAPIQTQGDKMWLTPTYYLFLLYKPHRGAEAVRVEVESAARDTQELDFLKPGSLPMVSATASRKEGRLTVSVSNRHAQEPCEVTLNLHGDAFREGTLHTLAADAPNAYNSAEQPNRVGVTRTTLNASGTTLTLTVPPCAVVTAEV